MKIKLKEGGIKERIAWAFGLILDTGRQRFPFHLRASKNLTFLSVVAPLHTDYFQRYVFGFSAVTVSFGNLTS